MALLKQSTAFTRMFKMIDASDHLSKKTGLTCTVNLSKAGAAFGAAAGTVTEVANGWYKVALTTADTNTLGDLAFYITATGADDTDFCDQVTAAVDQTGDSFARLGAPAGASHAADVAAVKVDTAAVKVQTDKLTFTVTNQIDANVIDWKGSAAPAMTGDAFARIGAAGAGLTALGDARIAHLDADVSSRTKPADTQAAVTTVGSVTGSVGSVTGLTASNLDATISSRLATSGYAAPDNADILLIKAKTDNLPAAPADESLIIAATNSLATSIAALPTTTTVNAIKTKTDSLNFTVSGKVDSNVTYVNGHAVTGDGHTGTEWGPAS